MQFGDDIGLDLLELSEQELSEQPVVAIPPSPSIQRHQEQAPRLQLPKSGMRTWLVEYRVALGSRQLVEDRRAEEEPLNIFRQLHQRLAVQVVSHVPIVTGDRRWVAVTVPSDQRGQVEADRPSLGSCGY